MADDISAIPAPLFLQNEEGKITLFLPAFVGKPLDRAQLRFQSRDTLNFIRSVTDSVLLTEIDAEIMEELAKTNEILVVEVDADKSIDYVEKMLEAQAQNKEYIGDEEETDLYRFVYEADVVGFSSVSK